MAVNSTRSSIRRMANGSHRGTDQVIRLWDAETGKATLRLEGHQEAVPVWPSFRSVKETRRGTRLGQ
jgi:hypothetical protein